MRTFTAISAQTYGEVLLGLHMTSQLQAAISALQSAQIEGIAAIRSCARESLSHPNPTIAW